MAFAAGNAANRKIYAAEEELAPTRPSDFARYADLIRHYGDSKALSQGKRLHAQITQLQLHRHTFIANLLIEMYSKCGRVIEARAVFERIENRNVFSWTIMISAYAHNAQSLNALIVFRRMDLEGLQPNKVTFLALINACSNLKSISEARKVHERIRCSPGCFVDLALATALINMFGKCGGIDEAEREFDQLQTKCVIAWNAMLTAYSQHKLHQELAELYQMMDLEGMKADTVTFLTVLSVCFNPDSLELGKSIHSHAITCGLEKTTVVGNCLVNMYGKCEDLVNAKFMFDKISKKNVFSWAIMISAYVQNGKPNAAVNLFHCMDSEGIKPDKITFVNLLGAFASTEMMLLRGRLIHQRVVLSGFDDDVYVGTAIVNMYAKGGLMQEAREIFEKLDKRDVVLWNALIAAEAQSGDGETSLKLYWRMCLEGIRANHVTYASVLDACSAISDEEEGLGQGRRVLESARSRGLDSSLVFQNSLISMFGKCGSLGDARSVFDNMSDRNVVSWTAMIEAYVKHGFNREALVMFEQMDFDNVDPNEFTFSTILSACSSLGSATEVKKIHSRFTASSFSISTVVGSALVTSYGSCGCVEEAKQVFDDQINVKNVVTWNALIEAYTRNGLTDEGLRMSKLMELEGLKPSSITFASVLNACCKLDALEEGKRIHERAVSCGFQLDGVLGVALLEMYGKLGRLEEARNVFRSMPVRDYTAWNALIAANAQSSICSGVVSVFQEMHLDGMEPNQTTFERLLNACSHSGLLDEAWEQFIYMREDSGVELAKKHYSSMVGLLARSGSVAEAQDLAQSMPFNPGVIVWKMLLHACELHGDCEGGQSAAKQASRLLPGDAVPYVLLSNLYAMKTET